MKWVYESFQSLPLKQSAKMPFVRYQLKHFFQDNTAHGLLSANICFHMQSAHSTLYTLVQWKSGQWSSIQFKSMHLIA